MKQTLSIVGMKHRNAEEIVAALPPGEPIVLIREPTNEFDPGAIQVWARGQHVGFIKATQARPLAIAMDEQIKKANVPPRAFRRIVKLVRSPNSGYPQAETEE